MSNDETKKIPPLQITSLNVNDDLEKKISYLKENPDARIVRLSDPQKGSTSQQLFGLISSIDTIKPVLNDILNFKIDLKEPNEFYQKYGNYGKEYKEIVEKLRNLEKLGLELLKEINDESAIKNKRLRERVFVKETQKPVENEKDTKTVAKTVTKTVAANKTSKAGEK